MIIKTSTYVKGYDWQTKWMYFLIGDIKNKVGADIKKGFDFKPVYSKEFLKTDVKLMVIKLQIFMIENS